MLNDTWPPDYHKVLYTRDDRLLFIRNNPKHILGAKLHYKDKPLEFIEDWVTTFDPRLATGAIPARLPFVLFKRQRELIQFFHLLLINQENGLVEKSRDAGLTWLGCAFSVWMWLFIPGASIGWGSRKSELVDEIGNPDSIFEKIRILIRELPNFFRPNGFSLKAHMTHMKIVNPENGSNIKGEIGDNIGRGGRSLIYFKDESAHYEHPESIEASLSSNTNIQVDISSVHGIGNVFHRKRKNGVDWTVGAPIAKGRTNVFVFDWRDDPRKSESWYKTKKAQHISEGLGHIFAQEVDRDYSASLEGIIIPGLWVSAAIDAHIILGFDETGGWGAALDVSDGGFDSNALTVRKGSILRSASEWGEVDTGATARRAIAALAGLNSYVELQYDCVGVGAGIKAETNRLIEEELMPKNIRLVPWNAGSAPLLPEKRVITLEKDSPLNKDFYKNLKAQAWWQLRLRFEKTWRAVQKHLGDESQKDFTYDSDELISLPSTLPLLSKITQELSQAVVIYDSKLKMVVDKAPEGTKSPNLADSIVMNFWPAKSPGILNLTPVVRAWGAGVNIGRNKFPLVAQRRRRVF